MPPKCACHLSFLTYDLRLSMFRNMTTPKVFLILICKVPLNKIAMLPLFQEDIALEITPTLSLPDVGNKSFSTLLILGVLFWALDSPRCEPMALSYKALALEPNLCPSSFSRYDHDRHIKTHSPFFYDVLHTLNAHPQKVALCWGPTIPECFLSYQLLPVV